MLALCLLLAPVDLDNLKRPEGVDEISSWLIHEHSIFQLKDGTLFPIWNDKALRMEFEGKKLLVRYVDGKERSMKSDGSFRILNVPIHFPLKKDCKESLRKCLDPKDTGKMYEAIQ